MWLDKGKQRGGRVASLSSFEPPPPPSFFLTLNTQTHIPQMPSGSSLPCISLLLLAVLLLLSYPPSSAFFVPSSSLHPSIPSPSASSTISRRRQATQAATNAMEMECTTRRRRRDEGDGGGKMKALEFYSGIGGWSEALEEALSRLGMHEGDVQVRGLVGR